MGADRGYGPSGCVPAPRLQAHFCGLTDSASPSTKVELVGRYLEFFGLVDAGLIFEDDFESSTTAQWSVVVGASP